MANESNDKNQAIVDYLIKCPVLSDYKLYFNFGIADDNNKQILAQSFDKRTNKNYNDGSVGMLYSITILDFKTVGYNAIIKQSGFQDENIEELSEVQKLIDWIDEQERLRNYPDFGKYCEIDSIYTSTNSPELQAVDTSVTPALAQYGVTINVEYIDTSKVIWNN